METDPRIPADRAHRAIASGQGLLVCAYDDEEKCRRFMFDGALTLQQLEQRLPSLPRDANVMFYCA